MSAPRQGPPPKPMDFEELDFTVEEENWNEYELADGNRIRGRILVKKIFRDPNNLNSLGIDAVPPIYSVFAPVANRGAQGNEPRPDEYQTLPNYEVRVTRNDERWNRYRILRTGQELRVRLIVNTIRRITNRFDNDGLPFYLVNAGPSVIINPPDGQRP